MQKKWVSGVIVLSLLAIVGVIVYANSFSNGFHYDDMHHIVKNPHIRSLDNVRSFFTNPETFSGKLKKHQHYRPLLMMSYAFNYAFGDLSPSGYHLTNLAFHIGTAFLVFLIVQAMLRIPPYPALAAALLFLTTPFNSEVVNYISTRSSVMSAFFYMLSFYCWVSYRSKKLEVRDQNKSYFLPLTSYFYLASLMAFLLGMLTKEVVITLPVILWLYDLYFVPMKRKTGHFKRLVVYLPFVLSVVIPYLIIRETFLDSGLPPFKRSIMVQFYTGTFVLIKYVRLLLFPTGLSVEHDIEIYDSFFVLPVAGSFILLISLLVLAVWLYRSRGHEWRVVSFFTLWFFVVLIPTTIFPLNAILQENRGYLAAVSMTVFAGIAAGKFRAHYPRLSLFSLIALLVLFSTATHTRNIVWKDDIILYSDVITKYPDLEKAYVVLAGRYRDNKMPEESIRVLKRYISRNPDNVSIRWYLGLMYREEGQNSLALKELDAILKVDPSNADFHSDIGALYYEEGMWSQAEEHLLKAIELKGNHMRSHKNLGLLYRSQGKIEAAAREFRTVEHLKRQSAGEGGVPEFNRDSDYLKK